MNISKLDLIVLAGLTGGFCAFMQHVTRESCVRQD